MIPKVIHYCWFGRNPLPDMALKCIDSWKQYCPDYEIVEWNEDNFDLDYFPYVREVYEARKWAFVSDVARLYALVTVGGIYMDTDVEVIRPLDDLLIYDAVSGFESEKRIPTGLMGSCAKQELFMEFLDDYKNIHFKRHDGRLDLTTNVTRITDHCLKYGLQLNNSIQTIKGFTLLPYDYLCPKNFENGELKITGNTFCIHHFDGSWHSEEEIFANRLAVKMEKVPGGSYLAKLIGIIKYRGVQVAVSEALGWIERM